MKILNKDIEYQPKTQDYSYSSKQGEKEKTKENLNTFFTLVVRIFIIFLFFFTLLFALLITLNYFNLILLSNISPAFSNFPKNKLTKDQFIKGIVPKEGLKPYNIPGTNEFTLDGTLESYNQNSVNVKFAEKSIALVYTLDSRFYFSKTIINQSKGTTPSAENITILSFDSSILKQENIGKNVSIQYKEEGNKKILESLTVY